jgi:hypothetical protein
MQKKTRKQYSAEFKAKVVKEMIKEEKTIGQLASEYGVHSNMLYRWRDQALAGYPASSAIRLLRNWRRKRGSVGSTLNGVVDISGSDAWAVGSSSDTHFTSQTLTEHWNGSMWSVITSLNVPSIL